MLTLVAAAVAAFVLLPCAARAETPAARPLPEGAAYVEYIESSGTQWIDLGIEGRCNLEIEGEGAYTKFPEDGCFIGSRSGNTRFYVFYYWKTMCMGYGDIGSSASTKGMTGVKYRFDSRFVPGSQTLAVDGAVIASRTVAAEYATGYNLYLFALNKDGVASWPSNGRLYSLKIWDLDADGARADLLADFRPCLDTAGVPCLFDAVTGAFRYNGGTGTLAYAPLPSADAPGVDHYVEYLESNGTQYFDTGVFGETGLKSHVSFSFLEVPQDAGVLAARAAGDARCYMVSHYIPPNGLYYSAGSLYTPEHKLFAATDTVYVADTDLFTDYRDFYVNGSQVGPRYTGNNELRTYNRLYLFGQNEGGLFKWPSKIRLYACTIAGSVYTRAKTDALVTLRDFRPCVDTAGVAGLYDAVSGRIFYPGGGALVAGPALQAAARVVASSASAFEGVATPDFGTDGTVQEGASETYSCAQYALSEGGELFECIGYTTATSEDGSAWSAESALVASRSATLAYPGGWWRLTWQWRHVGYRIAVEKPEGADVTIAAEDNGYPAGCYRIGETVTFTASPAAGAGRTFAGWSGDIPAGIFDTNLTVAVAANADKALVAHYRHAWTVAAESGGARTITDGVWTVEVEDGVVGAMDGIGILDFTDVERDLGFKIVSFKSWYPNTQHLGPQKITALIAPDATSVEALAFSECTHLERVLLSPGLSHIGRSAFYNCSALRDFQPSLSRYLSQARGTSAADMYVFMNCGQLREPLVVERAKRDDTLYLPDAFFQQTGIPSADFSRCRSCVDLAHGDSDDRATFRSCTDLISVTLPPRIEAIPRALFWGCSGLTDIYVTGVLPPPENIGYFYGWEHLKLTFHVSKALNPAVIEELRLRAPTAAEMAEANFPRQAYEAGRLLGVWDEPTAGWGKADKTFSAMWVVDWNPKLSTATTIFIQ